MVDVLQDYHLLNLLASERRRSKEESKLLIQQNPAVHRNQLRTLQLDRNAPASICRTTFDALRSHFVNDSAGSSLNFIEHKHNKTSYM